MAIRMPHPGADRGPARVLSHKLSAVVRGRRQRLPWQRSTIGAALERRKGTARMDPNCAQVLELDLGRK